jgi:hypothetical protein
MTWKQIEYPGAVYHVLNCGNRREPVFRDDQDRMIFLTALGEACQTSYLGRQRPPWLRVDRLLGEHGILKDSRAGRRQFARQMEERRRVAKTREWQPIRRGWCFGEKEFKQELLEQMEGRVGPHHGQPERQESEAARAERLVREELRRLGWNEAELTARRKGDGDKAALARRLRAETPMTWHWIAERLSMGTGGSAANGVRALKNRENE